MRKSKLRTLLIIPLSLSVLAAYQYFVCPHYNFDKTRQFSGPSFYNPYQGIDSCLWIKCNFHTHTRAWSGLTNGTSTAEVADSIYHLFGYTVRCISNYHCIEQYGNGKPYYLEAYEHGYGLLKNHQNVLGSSKINWTDFLFPQTIHNKQYIIGQLQDADSNVIIINHPNNRNAYPPADFSLLAGYHCIEIYPSGSTVAWDSALSAGKPVFCVANDDAHDVTDPRLVGRNYTWVGVKELNKKNILSSLKSGRSYTVIVPEIPGETMEEKAVRAKKGNVYIKKVKATGDSLYIAVSDTASFRFVGQGGKLLSAFNNCTEASYAMQVDDTYVRTRIFFHDGSEINVNPVFRYNGDVPSMMMPAIDENKTMWFRLAGILVMVLISLWIGILLIGYFFQLRRAS